MNGIVWLGLLLCVVPGSLCGASAHRLAPLLNDAVRDAHVTMHGPVGSTGAVPSTGFIVRVLDVSTDGRPRAFILRAGEHDLEALPLHPPASAAAETRTAVHATSAAAVILFSIDFTDRYFRGRAKCPACRLAMLHAGAAAASLVARLRVQRTGAAVVRVATDVGGSAEATGYRAMLDAAVRAVAGALSR